jgi:hypothetical protein
MNMPRYIANLARVNPALAEEIVRKDLAYAERLGRKSAATHFRKVLAELPRAGSQSP